MRLYFEEQNISHVILDIFRRPVYLFLNSSLLTLTSLPAVPCESMMLRIAKPMNYIPVTPSVQQISDESSTVCPPNYGARNLVYSNSVLRPGFPVTVPFHCDCIQLLFLHLPWPCGKLGEVSFFIL